MEEWWVLPCLHRSCVPCFEQWAARHKTCPECTRPFRRTEPQKVTTARPRAVAPGDGGVVERVPAALQAPCPVAGVWGTKITALVKHLKSLRGQGEPPKSLVFTKWANVRRLIGQALAANGLCFVEAATPGAVAQFQHDPALQVCLMDFEKDCAGTHLVCATHVSFMEPQHRDDLELQAAGRVHRVGQARETYVHRFVMAGTVEQEMMRIKTARVLTRNKSGGGEFSWQQLQSLFSQPPA